MFSWLSSWLSQFNEPKFKTTFFLTLYSAACLIASLSFAQCSGKRAQEQIEKANAETEAAKQQQAMVNAENERLRDVMARANEILEQMLRLNKEAQDKHEERIETIENDSDANDWLACELPDSVRTAFRDYCQDRNDPASESASFSVRKAGNE
jgi:hypothetical protein